MGGNTGQDSKPFGQQQNGHHFIVARSVIPIPSIGETRGFGRARIETGATCSPTSKFPPGFDTAPVSSMQVRFEHAFASMQPMVEMLRSFGSNLAAQCTLPDDCDPPS